MSSQQTVFAELSNIFQHPRHDCYAGDSYQLEPLPTPTTETGEQVTPTGTLRSCTTTPMDLRMGATAELPAGWTDWQHWRAPVSQASAAGAGVATARIARAESVKSLANMLERRKST